MKQKERSTMSWLAEFAGEKKSLYIASVIFAIIGVACSIIPYVIMGDMIARLIDGNRDWHFYLRDGIIMAVFWIGRVTFHGISTSCSHKATFHVLATIRKRLCDKLAKVPLGRVKDTPSGSLKNIMVERVDCLFFGSFFRQITSLYPVIFGLQDRNDGLYFGFDLGVVSVRHCIFIVGICHI